MATTSTPAPGAADLATYGVTPQGFIVKPFQQILSDAFARAQLSFGPDIDLRSTSSIRKLIELGCLDAGLLWMALDDVYHSGFTSTAVGDALDLLGADLGLQRAPTNASGQATFKLGSTAPPGSAFAALSCFRIFCSPASWSNGSMLRPMSSRRAFPRSSSSKRSICAIIPKSSMPLSSASRNSRPVTRK